MVKRPRGTRDFTPEEMDERKILLSSLRKTAEAFGYREIKTPTFEHLDLFTLRSGPDIIEQIYAFNDKGGRDLALRPELTASAMRFYVNELQSKPKPLKLYYFDNCFRYERPQRGRFREFWQFGVEFIGCSTELALAELLSLTHTMLAESGLGEFVLKIGYLDIIRKVIDKADLSDEDLSSAMILIDKKNIDGLEELLYENDCGAKLVSDLILLAESKGGKEIIGMLEDLSAHHPEIGEPLKRYRKVLEKAELLGLTDYVLDPGIVRGLDYYSGVVFEAEVEELGAQKQICGGGEYSLIPIFGGREVETAGFALGFDRLLEALKEQGVEFAERPIELFLIPITSREIPYTAGIAKELREAGLKVDMELRGRNISKGMKYADSVNASYVGIIGEDEVSSGKVSLKHMRSGDQESVKKEDLIDHLLRE